MKLMLDLNIRTIKQTLIFGVTFLLIFGFLSSIIFAPLPSYGDMGAYFMWFVLFLIKVIFVPLLVYLLIIISEWIGGVL